MFHTSPSSPSHLIWQPPELPERCSNLAQSYHIPGARTLPSVGTLQRNSPPRLQRRGHAACSNNLMPNCSPSILELEQEILSIFPFSFPGRALRQLKITLESMLYLFDQSSKLYSRRLIPVAYNKEQGISSKGYTPGKPLPPLPLLFLPTLHATCIRSLLVAVVEPRMQSLVHFSAFVTQNFSF